MPGPLNGYIDEAIASFESRYFKGGWRIIVATPSTRPKPMSWLRVSGDSSVDRTGFEAAIMPGGAAVSSLVVPNGISLRCTHE
jgi:hypothetical protein